MSRTRSAAARPELDDAQRGLIARLEGRFEFWQTAGHYDARHHQVPPEVRHAAGAQLAGAVPHEAHAAWTPPKNRPGAVDTVLAGNAGRQPALLGQQPLARCRLGRRAAGVARIPADGIGNGHGVLVDRHGKDLMKQTSFVHGLHG